MDQAIDAELLARAADSLANDGVVLVPTDTVYGLAVHPASDKAAERLFAMKRRPRSRNLPVVVSSVDDLADLGVEVTEPAARLMRAYFPGPLTVALGVRSEAAPAWLAGRTEIALRVPGDDTALALLRRTGPLLITSANIHAQTTPESVPEILAMLDGAPDVVIDAGIRAVIPSTLVNCNLPSPVIERIGALSKEQIEAALA